MWRSIIRPRHTPRYTVRGFPVLGFLCRLSLRPYATLRKGRIPIRQLGALSAWATFFVSGHRMSNARDLHFGYPLRFTHFLIFQRALASVLDPIRDWFLGICRNEFDLEPILTYIWPLAAQVVGAGRLVRIS